MAPEASLRTTWEHCPPWPEKRQRSLIHVLQQKPAHGNSAAGRFAETRKTTVLQSENQGWATKGTRCIRASLGSAFAQPRDLSSIGLHEGLPPVIESLRSLGPRMDAKIMSS
ncbi:hypothetical protein E2P81_ATG07513 [Venturia nashicola]|uniref:Uncharacterized protein n=1 Tax=Venturia nashicola TaxID=86259 RepID=A0A4Z1NWD2_9PEZI|nr:hypothetical protein E6O75_ATG07671 [Venturia nashicola]TLD32023.1 hypothetical protein E2P81_ATG07513 [Venturia nashicola]